MPPARRGVTTPQPSPSSSTDTPAATPAAAKPAATRKPAAKSAAARKPAAKSAAKSAAAKSAAAKPASKSTGTKSKPAAKPAAKKASAARKSTAKGGPAKVARDAQAAAEERFDAVAQRLRKLNERIIEAGRDAGESTLTSYEKALKALANGIERGPGSSEVDWIANLATQQAKFIRDVTKTWTSAARDLLK